MENIRKRSLIFLLIAILSIIAATLFSACEESEAGFTYTLNSESTGYILGYSGKFTEEELVIPKLYNDLPVTEINKNAFKKNDKIKSIVFETTYDLTIGKSAFKNCSALNNVTFKSGNISVSEDAFADCNIDEINLGSATLNWHSDTFFNSKINKLTISGGKTNFPNINLNYVTVSNGSQFTYTRKDAFAEFKVADDLFLEETDLQHKYTTGVFNVVDHYGPLATKIYLPQTLTTIPNNFFGDDGNKCSVIYDGLKADWDKVYVTETGNENYFNGNVNIIYAEDRSYSVKFVDETGAEIAAKRTVEYGKNVPVPNIGDHNGDTFVAWYKDDKLTQKWDFEKDVVTSDTVLYAKFVSASHVHDYSINVVSPTCTERGYTEYTCECEIGNYIDNYTDALGHDYNYENIVWNWRSDYTCSATVTCVREGCNEQTYGNKSTITATVTEKLVNEPTCTESGSKLLTATISVNGQTYTNAETKTVSLSTISHTPVSDENAVAATCYSTGLTASTHCSVCSAKLSEQTDIPKLPHTPASDENAVAATCSSTGLTASTHCSVCNIKLNEQTVIPKIPHTPVSDENAVAATCYSTGLTASTHCSVCSAKLSKQTEIAKLPHTPGAAATCITSQLCTVCGTVLKEVGEHQLSDITFACTACGKSEFESYKSFDAIAQICTYTQSGSTLTFFYDSAEGIELDFSNMNFAQSYKDCSNFVFRFGKNATTVLVKGGGKSYGNASFIVDDRSGKFILALDSLTLSSNKVIDSSATDFELRFLGGNVNISSNSSSGTAIGCNNVTIKNYAKQVKIYGGNGGRGNDCSSTLTGTSLAGKGGNGGAALSASSLVIETNQGDLQFYGGNGGMGGTGYYASSVDIQEQMVGGTGGQGGMAVSATSITLNASDSAKVSFYGGKGGTGGTGGTSTGAGGKGGRGGIGGTGGYAVSTSNFTILMAGNTSVVMVGGNGGTGGTGGPHAKIAFHTCGDGGTGGTGGYAVNCKTMTTTLKSNAVIVATGGSGGTGGTGGADGSLGMKGGNGGTGGTGGMTLYASESISFYTENKAAVNQITLNIGLKGYGGAGGHPTGISPKDGNKGSDGSSASKVANVTIEYGIE